MQEYDEVFGKGSSQRNFKIEGDFMEIDEERKE